MEEAEEQLEDLEEQAADVADGQAHDFNRRQIVKAKITVEFNLEHYRRIVRVMRKITPLGAADDIDFVPADGYLIPETADRGLTTFLLDARRKRVKAARAWPILKDIIGEEDLLRVCELPLPAMADAYLRHTEECRTKDDARYALESLLEDHDALIVATLDGHGEDDDSDPAG